ncbi:WD40 repeat-like protein [Aaosphaeria arxii CBS 175.79]|uniref:WD40 repeat-like protein n=1 Tax=Aaosphaeria arxii CBS 175.79 TaxID=1450172 RepID=A0A6A5Y1X4_9PLEO|nr:WD40 repeat-like protein [Aaosphaeria arxii CBS 175.79]KAF2019219.1 WD40 repeat-like protein [Aaosphaeria arxii CBS 175.79]
MPLLYGEETHKQHLTDTEDDRSVSTLPTVPQAAFDSFDKQHREVCLPDTRVELRRDIAEWADGSDNKVIYWLSGVAGTGKSTIARTIARKYQHQGHLGANFFFSRGGGEVSRADKLFTTLAFQLANKIPALKRHIAQAISEQETIATHSFRDQWDQLILNPLAKLDPRTFQTPIVMILDALDECESERDIRIILRLLATTTSIPGIRLRILITSRPEISDRCNFSQIPAAERQMFVLHEISPTVMDRDLSLFFEHSLTTIRQERGFAVDWPGRKVIKRLVEISGGLFIWASTACRFIRDGRRLAMRRIALLLNGSSSEADPEKQLDDIYTSVLRNSQELYGILREVLGSIVILFSPLSVESLTNLLPLSANDIDETLANLHTIFNIPSQKEHPIRLHHPTFRDFLINKNRCLIRASGMLKDEMCNLKSPGSLVENINPQRIKSSISPELEYACLYWVQHYRESRVQIRDGDKAHVFFQKYFLSWFETVSLVGKGSEVAGIIRMYSAILLPEDNARQFPFVQNARRWAFAFQSIIERAPLQNYCAALAFISPSNDLRSHFWTQMHPLIHDVRLAEGVSGNPEKRLTSRTFFVNDLAFTPNGRQLASGAIEAEARLWDTTTLAPLAKLKGPANKISSVTISADGMLMAGGSDDTTVVIWDLNTHTILHTLREHSRWVNSVAFSPDGKLLASGSMDESVRVWNPENGEQLSVLESNSSCINAVAFSPDNSMIAAASVDQTVRLWNIKSEEIILLLDGHTGSVNSVRFSPDGMRIVSGADDKTVRVWDTRSGSEIMVLEDHQRRVMTVAWSPDARTLATGSEDTTVRLWDADTGAGVAILKGHTSGINAVTFGPDSRTVASSSFNEEVRLWNVLTGESIGKLTEFPENSSPQDEAESVLRKTSTAEADVKSLAHSGTVICAAFSPDGHLIGTGAQDNTVKIWSKDASQLHSMEGHAASINKVIFSSNNQLLASASVDKTVRVWNAVTGTLYHALRGHSDNVRSIRFAYDDQLLLSCSTDKTAAIWDVETGILLNRLVGHADTVNDVIVSPVDLTLVATCSADSTVRIWQVSSEPTCQILEGHSDAVNCISFSSDGKFIASDSADSTIRLWNVSGEAYHTLRDHTSSVTAVAFSRDNKFMVSSSEDQTVRLWETSTFLVIGKHDLSIAVGSLAFSSCGKYIDTDRGVLDVASIPESTGPISPYNPVNTFVSQEWLRRGSEDVLWLPEDFHATSVAVRGNNVVLGHAGGGVTFVYF